MKFRELYETNSKWCESTELLLSVYDQEGLLLFNGYVIIYQIMNLYPELEVIWYLEKRIQLREVK